MTDLLKAMPVAFGAALWTVAIVALSAYLIAG